MVSSERLKVTLTGGAPWGFRLAGGGAMPLTINKIRKKSVAHTKGLLEGDAVISINGIPVHDKSQDEALELVEQAEEKLELEIFRGDVDELTKDVPKKLIQIPGASAGGGFIISASVDDMSSSSGQVVPSVDTSSELILTTSVDDVSSDTYQLDAGTGGGGLTLTATVDDMSGATYTTGDDSGSGFILTASVDDMTSSTNQIVETSPVIQADFGDFTATASSGVDDVHSFTAQTAVLAEPFTDTRASLSPARFSPQPPRVSPKPLSPLPVANRTPSPRPPAPPVSPKPQTTSTMSTATFDDGKTRKEVAYQQHVTTNGDGRSTRVVQQENTVTTTTTSKRGPSFVKSQTSAFNAVPPETSSTTTKRVTSSTLKSSSNVINQQPAISTSVSTNFQPPKPYQPLPPPSIPSSKSTSSIGGIAPVFKPSRFVPGPSKKEIPGLYGPNVQPIDVNASYTSTDGKENVQPMFQVKNIVSEKSKSRGRDIWRPNIWLPDQQQSTSPRRQAKQPPQPPPQQPKYTTNQDFSPYAQFPVPSLPAGISLMDKNRPLSSRASEMDESYYYDDDDYHQQQHYGGHGSPRRLHIFAPPVEIHANDDEDGPFSPYDPDGEHAYMEDFEDGGPLSPDSSVIRRKKKMYADSAFYDTPGKCFPTITEQMKLCKIIAQSLTSAANKRARGAKMFMRRKRKSNKWVHEGHSEWSSSAGDVANLHELDSELSPDEDGKALFYFKIPNLKNRVSGDAKQTKMALSQEQFEKLRLSAKKCDHRVVPPDTCFDIVADLKAHKGRGGRMFERRKQRSDKFVIANENLPQRTPYSKLEHVLSQPVRQETTPWQAAMRDEGNVDAAFSHISEMERNQKLNQILKLSPPRKLQTAAIPPGVQSAPLPPLGRTSLKSDNTSSLLRGKNFNRTAIGWQGGGEYPIADSTHHVSPTRSRAPSMPPAAATSTSAYADYNNKVKAWQSPGDSPYVNAPQSQTDQWDQRHTDDRQTRRYDDRSAGQWAAPTYSAQPEVRQELFQPRPKSWVTDNYDTRFKDDYDYNYVPVDTRYVSEQPTVAYMQPIIPGTDL